MERLIEKISKKAEKLNHKNLTEKPKLLTQKVDHNIAEKTSEWVPL